MKHNLLKLAVMALSMSVAGFSSAADVTASWAFGEKSYNNKQATLSEDGVFSSALFMTYGTAVAGNTDVVPMTDGTTVTTTRIAVPASQTYSDENYISFIVTPIDETVFTPKNLSFTAGGVKAAGIEMKIKLFYEDEEPVELVESETLEKINNTGATATPNENVFGHSYDIDGFENLTKDFEVRIYLQYTTAKAQNAGFANVVLTCATGEDSDTPTEPENPEPETPEIPAGFIGIPTSGNAAFSWNDAVIDHAVVQTADVELGSTGSNTVAVFNIYNTVEQSYFLSFKTGEKNDGAQMSVAVDGILDETIINVANTGSWTPVTTHCYLIENLAEGEYELTFRGISEDASGYCGNWGYVKFIPFDEFDVIPGVLNLENGSYSGMSTENKNGTVNCGNIKDGRYGIYTFFCNEAGIYDIIMPLARYDGGVINIKIVDSESGNVEVTHEFTIPETSPRDYTEHTIELKTELSRGLKEMTMTFNADHTGYICNYYAPSFAISQRETSAIEDIVVGSDDAKCVYYNLQGVRVVNPHDGIFIKVSGTTTEKVKM